MIASHAAAGVARSVWSALYQGKISVWVEDEMTEQVLRQLWHDTNISVLAAGGKQAVNNFAHQATPRSLQQRVFAVVDRDWGSDNSDEWSNPQKRKFVWPVHELENLLLDFEVLASLAHPSRKVTAETLREALYTRAKEIVYWIACGAVIAQVHKERDDIKFQKPVQPPAPGGIRNRDDALLILGARDAQPFWDGTRALLGRWERTAVEQALDRLIAEYQSHLETEKWRETFPGKELLTYARSTLGLTSDTNLDLALRISEAWLKEPGRIPAPVLRLHQVLRERAGLPLPSP